MDSTRFARSRCTIVRMNTRETILTRLGSAFDPSHLEVIDESAGHRSGPGAETHFRVVLISQDFLGKTLLQRHRAVNACLKEELAGGVHALALNTYTPEEWQAREMRTRASPPCAGSS